MAKNDRFAGADMPDFPAQFSFPITPSDGTDLPMPTKALYIGGAGNVTVMTAGDGNLTTFVNCGNGQILPVRAQRVTAATATNIVGLG